MCTGSFIPRYGADWAWRAEFPPHPPSARLEPERKGRFQVFLWRQILIQIFFLFFKFFFINLAACVTLFQNLNRRFFVVMRTPTRLTA